MNKKYNTNSIKSVFFKILIKLSRFKRNTLTISNSIKYMNRCNKKKYNYKIFKNMNRIKYKNLEYYTYNQDKQKNIIFYIHGGSFVDKPLKMQIDFAKKVADRIDAELIVPLYTTLPNGNCSTFLEEMTELYKSINRIGKKVFIMGDSAGGGGSLSLNMNLVEKGIDNADAVILLSPWLDLSLENSEILKKEKQDIVCSIKGNKYLGKKWAGNVNIKNYKVSPIYGKFNTIKKIFVSCSSNELCQPDCIKLANLLRKEKHDYKYIEFQKQFHNFELYPTKESDILIDEIYKYIVEER